MCERNTASKAAEVAALRAALAALFALPLAAVRLAWGLPAWLGEPLTFRPAEVRPDTAERRARALPAREAGVTGVEPGGHASQRQILAAREGRRVVPAQAWPDDPDVNPPFADLAPVLQLTYTPA